jgi:hypothetical protein
VERFDDGGGDLDVLVDRRALADLVTAVAPLGFRLVLAPPGFVTPAVLSLVAPHPDHQRLVHLHVHTQLVLGPSAQAQYRLPVERAVLGSVRHEDGLLVPTPAWRWILHTLHETLRLNPRDALRTRAPEWIRRSDSTLAELERAADPTSVAAILARHVAFIPASLLAECAVALASDASQEARASAAVRLRHALRSVRRDPPLGALARRALRALHRAIPRVGRAGGPGRARLAGGGFVVALFGGDGSGKTSSAYALSDWFGTLLDVRHFHLGRPRRGALTLLCGGTLRAARYVYSRIAIPFFDRAVAHLELARVLCTGLDRRREHAAAHRHAAAGGISICERHPLREGDAHAGPSEVQGVALDARSRLADRMRLFERGLYARLAPPDLTLVLRLPPEEAVRRKPEEPAEYVRRRAQLVSDGAWDGPGFRTIDASRPRAEVLREIRSRIWEAL